MPAALHLASDAAAVGHVVEAEHGEPVGGVGHAAARELGLHRVPDVGEVALVTVVLEAVLHVRLDVALQVSLESKGGDSGTNLSKQIIEVCRKHNICK